MSAIRLDYDTSALTANLAPAADCSQHAWSKVRRLFEDRYPDVVQNRSGYLAIPWWAFLSLRDALRFVLRTNGITSIDCSAQATELLLLAKERADRFTRADALRRSRSSEQVASDLLASGFERPLLPYQLRNVTQLCSLPAGASFSVPGSGKTSEALAYYFLTKDRDDRLLVIAPKNAFIAWEDELTACAPSVKMSFTRLTGGHFRIQEILESDPVAVIISYQQLTRVMNEVTAYIIRNEVFMFIDESHRMKRGAAGVQGSSILNIAHLPKRKLILSGTPMPNSPDDLVAQFTFLYPEYATKPDQVIERLRSIFVRTTKNELGLMAPRRIVREVPMSSAQERLYTALASDAGRHLESLSVSDRISFRRFATCVQYMLQAASNPVLLASTALSGHDLLAGVIAEGLSPKLEHTCSLARKWAAEGHKVVIWSTFVRTVEHLAALLSDLGAQYIHGGVATGDDPDAYETREARIREFNEPSSACRVLVANPAACSEGISLHHVCHHAIYVDRNYNAANYLQSEDRIHRIGLPADVETYIIILASPGTVDQSVDRRLREKVDAMRTILDDADLSIQPLNIDADEDVDGIDAKDVEDLRRMLRVGS